MAVDDQLVEVCRLLGGEPVESQIVQDKQVRGQEGPEGSVHRVVDSGLAHGPEEVVRVDEADGVSRAYGGEAQGLGYEALAHPGGSHQQAGQSPAEMLLYLDPAADVAGLPECTGYQSAAPDPRASGNLRGQYDVGQFLRQLLKPVGQQPVPGLRRPSAVIRTERKQSLRFIRVGSPAGGAYG